MNVGSSVRHAIWALIGMVMLGSAAAADNIYVVFENPEAGALAARGNATDPDMAKIGAFEANTLNFGIENSIVLDPRAGAIGPGRASFRPLTMTLPLSPGVPALTQTAGAGGHYNDVTVHFRTSGANGVEYATLSLKLVAVSSVEVSAGTNAAPEATVALTYGSMKLDVYPLDAKGAPAKDPLSGQWNAMTGAPDYATIPKPK